MIYLQWNVRGWTDIILRQGVKAVTALWAAAVKLDSASSQV